MESSKPHIYLTTNLVNGKIYIGQHNGTSSSYKGSGVALKRAFKKYGKDNFTCEIIQICANQETTDKAEEFWIRWYDSTNRKIGYNISTTANTYAMYGADHPMYGKTHTDEAKRKIVENRNYSDIEGCNNGRYVNTDHITDDKLIELLSTMPWQEMKKILNISWVVFNRLLKERFGSSTMAEARDKFGLTYKRKLIYSEKQLKELSNRVKGKSNPMYVNKDHITDKLLYSFLINVKCINKEVKKELGISRTALINHCKEKYGVHKKKDLILALEYILGKKKAKTCIIT
jgi:group I intron endonuclease